MKNFLKIILAISFSFLGFQSAHAEPEIPTIPEVSFSYASLHAIDNTHIVIPVSKGSIIIGNNCSSVVNASDVKLTSSIMIDSSGV